MARSPSLFLTPIADQIIEMLLKVPQVDRDRVIGEIEANGIFCWRCGVGSRDRPNRRCYCDRDE